METRYFHGQITPADIARSLIENFNRGSLQAQIIGEGEHIVVQIATNPHNTVGGRTAIGVQIDQTEDGIAVSIGNQDWLGIAASLGKTALSTWKNPLSLLGRLDDIAQDIDNIQLVNKIWMSISSTVEKANASFEFSERFKRVVCPYCDTANPLGEPNCIACGAPLGKNLPTTCSNCGYIINPNEVICPNCKVNLTER